MYLDPKQYIENIVFYLGAGVCSFSPPTRIIMSDKRRRKKGDSNQADGADE